MATLSNDSNGISGAIASAAHGIGDKVGELASQAQHAASADGRARQAAAALTRRSRRAVADRPLTALALGAGVGLLIGWAVFR